MGLKITSKTKVSGSEPNYKEFKTKAIEGVIKELENAWEFSKWEDCLGECGNTKVTMIKFKPGSRLIRMEIICKAPDWEVIDVFVMEEEVRNRFVDK